MATGSNGTLDKKSPASMHTSVIVLSLVLIFAIRNSALDVPLSLVPVSYTHLTLPTKSDECRSRWSPYH